MRIQDHVRDPGVVEERRGQGQLDMIVRPEKFAHVFIPGYRGSDGALLDPFGKHHMLPRSRFPVFR